MLSEIAADEREKGFRVGNEGSGLGNVAQGDLGFAVEVPDWGVRSTERGEEEGGKGNRCGGMPRDH